MKRLCILVAMLISSSAWAAEVIPPSPPTYFNDYANVTSEATRKQLNQQLEDFEKQTTNQIVVAVYPKMQTDRPIEDYAVRLYQAWKIGTKSNNNGALLLVYVQDHKMRIATGYGLEGALPDALCLQIMDDEIAPRFKQGDYDGGLRAGVAAIIAATKNEYHAKGAAHTQSNGGNTPMAVSDWFIIVLLGAIVLFFYIARTRSLIRNGFYYGSSGRSGWYGGGWGGGGSWGGGGGGGFSGGGGSTGGGGASGSW